MECGVFVFPPLSPSSPRQPPSLQRREYFDEFKSFLTLLERTHTHIHLLHFIHLPTPLFSPSLLRAPPLEVQEFNFTTTGKIIFTHQSQRFLNVCESVCMKMAGGRGSRVALYYWAGKLNVFSTTTLSLPPSNRTMEHQPHLSCRV